MSTFKGTPGPWENYGGDNGSCEIGTGPTDVFVSRSDKNSGNYVISREEMEANARAIAAVPDMIEALKLMVEYFEWAINDPKFPAYIQAKAALSKALD